MKKSFILLLYIFILANVFATPLNEFDVDEYTKTERYEMSAEPYKGQHPTAIGNGFIKILYYPNFQPRPKARVIFLAKYAGTSLGALESRKGECISTLRYALTDFSNQKGFTGSPKFYKIRDEIKTEQKDERFKGWWKFEEEVEFYP